MSDTKETNEDNGREERHAKRMARKKAVVDESIAVAIGKRREQRNENSTP